MYISSEHSIRRRSPDWWDNLSIPSDAEDPFEHLASVSPPPVEHDYVLATDGSGHQGGWGAAASVAHSNDTGDKLLRVSANYGSTTNRNELSAMLDGLHAIADHRLRLVTSAGLAEVPNKAPLQIFSDDNRITVLWYTDRKNLASALIYNEYLEPLNARDKEIDLWMRFSAFARVFCITPMFVPRNTIPTQGLCDSLCGIARASFMEDAGPRFREITPSNIYNLWTNPLPQSALF